MAEDACGPWQEGFWPLAPWWHGGADANMPSLPRLNAWARAQGGHTRAGHPLQFVLPRADGLGYEARIAARGEVSTRPDNWHDCFNALVWLAYPKAKAALSAAHCRAGCQTWAPGMPRGTCRDGLTHFDECGLVVVSDDAELLDLIRDFQWKALFVGRRGDLARHLRWFVFGHATLDALRAPYHGLTAKALLWHRSEDWIGLDPIEQRQAVDHELAVWLDSDGLDSPRCLQPVPLLGIPGVTPRNQAPGYYDDTTQFRPGRRRGPGAAMDGRGPQVR